jgi:hypothetical protein
LSWRFEARATAIPAIQDVACGDAFAASLRAALERHIAIVTDVGLKQWRVHNVRMVYLSRAG